MIGVELGRENRGSIPTTVIGWRLKLLDTRTEI
jgi:hypothetical protein